MPTTIDIHPHIVSTDTERYPITPIGGERSNWSEHHSITLEQLIAAMDEAGVERAAVVHSSTTYGFNNAYVADAVAAYPNRLTGVFSVNMLGDDASERIRYWYDKGLTGMRVFARGSTIKGQWMALDDPKTYPAWQTAVDLDISVATNVLAKEEPLSQVRNLLERYKGLKIVLDHVGRVDATDGAPFNNARPLFDLAKHEGLHLKLTPRHVLDVTAEGSKATPTSFYSKVISEFGAGRIAFGSNYPSSKGTLSQIVQRTRAALSELPASDLEWIFEKTALKLYPVLATMKQPA